MRTCPHCNRQHQRNHAYCAECFATYMRERRATTTEPMTPQRHLKAWARTEARKAKLRGDLTAQPCRDCGAEEAEMHHPNYTRPLDVIWLCFDCHRAEHNA